MADQDSLRHELESLWDFHMRRLRDGPAMNALADRVVFTQPLPLRVSQCDGCGLLRRDPPDDPEAIRDRYRGDPVDPAALDRLFEAHLPGERARARRLTRSAGVPGRGVEVGSYTGAFLAAAGEAGWTFEGVDTNEHIVDYVRRRGLRARPGTPASLEEEEGLDAVVLWTCLDQLPDPASAIRRAAAAVRPGGVVAVRVPNGAFYRRLRPLMAGRLRPLAERYLSWNNWMSFPYLHGFTLDSVERLMGRLGLRVVHRSGDAPPALASDETRSWGRFEERVVKRSSRALAARAAPWLEVHARRLPPRPA